MAAVTMLLAIHIGFRAPRRVTSNGPADFGLTNQEVCIQTVAGKKLFAWWLPEEVPAPTIIILHGWGGSAGYMLPLAIPFKEAGMNVLLFDARSHGRSDAASFSSLPRFAEDIAAAISWVGKQCSGQSDSIILLGHSVGAGAVLYEASKRDDISAVISISAFAHPEWMMQRYLQRFRIPGFLVNWILRYVEWVIRHRFDEIAPMNTVCNIRCPVLLVHGGQDETVPVQDALAIRENCDDGLIELFQIEDAGHESVDKVEQHGYQMVEFLRRHGVIN